MALNPHRAPLMQRFGVIICMEHPGFAVFQCGAGIHNFHIQSYVLLIAVDCYFQSGKLLRIGFQD